MNKFWRQLPGNAGLFCLSVALYVLAFPIGNFQGLPLLVFVALIPLFFWIQRIRWWEALPAGLVYGALVNGLGCYWLHNFAPPALFIGMFVAAIRFGPLFLLLRLTARRRFALPAAIFFWAATDIISSLWYLAYPYMTVPYALYESGTALFIASLGGVSLVSVAIVTVNAFFYLGLRAWRPPASQPAGASAAWPPASNLLGQWRSLGPLLAGLTASLLFLLPPVSPPAATDGQSPLLLADTTLPPSPGRVRVALLQPDNPHPQRDYRDYGLCFSNIRRLSEPLKDAQLDLLVWHETAVVPAISWYLRYRQPRELYEIVQAVDSYLSGWPAPVVLGNGWADPANSQRPTRQNVAVMYQNGGEAQRYAKMKLVPFSEHFPYARQFPALAVWLEEQFGHFWKAGVEYTIFDTGKIRFAAPVCFEDSFGQHFAAYGPVDSFVVLTQDSWAKADAMQLQHLSMSAFRAAESGRIVLRVANSGYTAGILPGGRIEHRLPPFEPDSLILDIATGYRQATVFMAVGKHFDKAVFIIGTLLLLLCCLPESRSKLDKNPSV